MLSVRTAILHYPAWHEGLSQCLHQVLREWPLQVLVIEETQCGGHRHVVEEKMRQICDREEADWLITLGGTWPAPGPSSDEIVSLATTQVLERTLPGISEVMRARLSSEFPFALLDTSMAGIRGVSFLLNLPAHEDLIPLCLESIRPVVPALLQALRGDCISVWDAETQEVQEKTVHGLRASEFAAFRAATHSSPCR